jgi:predicted type IV restriction endonuclease
MPYIKQDKRKIYEKALTELVHLLREVPEEERDGHINYIVTVLLKRLYQPPNYRRYNKAIGVLECIKMEFYRRMVSPYEEDKIRENGDVQ